MDSIARRKKVDLSSALKVWRKPERGIVKKTCLSFLPAWQGAFLPMRQIIPEESSWTSQSMAWPH